MIGWRFQEALAVDTREAVTRWWADRHPSPAAPIPDGLVEDLQTARLALDDGLQRRLWDLTTLLPEPQRTACKEKIAELDPWHVLYDMPPTRYNPAATGRGTAAENHQELLAALKESARRRERLNRPSFSGKGRRRLRDLARGRGGLAAVLKDDDACRMLRFGAMLCDLVEIRSVERVDPDPDKVRAMLAELTEGDARHAAEAVLKDPLVGTDDRGRPVDSEIMEFVRAVIGAAKRRANHKLTPTITRAAAGAPGWRDCPGPDVQLILDLLACHAPSKTAEAVADLVKRA